ncbi:MAG: hypothetical protein AAF714_11665 [Pseudomonadota bacterium]
MSVDWQPMTTYQQGTDALFWVDDGHAEYVVYGRLTETDGQAEIWNDNDFGYSGNAIRWAPCSPP